MKLIFPKGITNIHFFLDISTVVIFDVQNIKIGEQNEQNNMKKINVVYF